MVDASERLQVLLTQEATIYRTSDYLARVHGNATFDAPPPEADGNAPDTPSKRRKASSNMTEDSGRDSSSLKQTFGEESSAADYSTASLINKHWREKICEWAYQVVDHFDLNREVVSIAMSHLDRYISAIPATIDKNTFQLLAMTCLYLSIKLNEYKHLLIPGSKSSMDTILQLSRGFFTLEQMERMEYEVLQRLQWHVHPPTPQLFCKHFLFFLSIEEHEIHDLAQFMVELSVMDYFFVSYKPSEIAIAGVLNAIVRLKPEADALCKYPFHRILVDINTPEISACRVRLALIFAQAHDQASPEQGIETPKSSDVAVRTTSPVSVIAAPQPCVYHNAVQHLDDRMDAEYKDNAQ